MSSNAKILPDEVPSGHYLPKLDENRTSGRFLSLNRDIETEAIDFEETSSESWDHLTRAIVLLIMKVAQYASADRMVTELRKGNEDEETMHALSSFYQSVSGDLGLNMPDLFFPFNDSGVIKLAASSLLKILMNLMELGGLSGLANTAELISEDLYEDGLQSSSSVQDSAMRRLEEMELPDEIMALLQDLGLDPALEAEFLEDDIDAFLKEANGENHE